jgi:hypothetical protein
MFRIFFFGLIGVVAITFLRMVIGLVGRAVNQATSGPREAGNSGEKLPPQTNCPVCGKALGASPQLRRDRKGGVVLYCSEACAK